MRPTPAFHDAASELPLPGDLLHPSSIVLYSPDPRGLRLPVPAAQAHTWLLDPTCMCWLLMHQGASLETIASNVITHPATAHLQPHTASPSMFCCSTASCCQHKHVCVTRTWRPAPAWAVAPWWPYDHLPRHDLAHCGQLGRRDLLLVCQAPRLLVSGSPGQVVILHRLEQRRPACRTGQGKPGPMRMPAQRCAVQGTMSGNRLTVTSSFDLRGCQLLLGRHGDALCLRNRGCTGGTVPAQHQSCVLPTS